MKLAKRYFDHLIALLTFIILSFVINSHKIWYIQQIVYYSDTDIIRQYFSRIGGISEWISDIIGQLFYFKVWGNLILGLLFFLIFEFSLQIFNRLVNGKFNFIASLILPLLAFFVLKNPAFPINIIFQVLLTISLIYFFFKIYPSRTYVNTLLFLLFLLVVFYINSFFSSIAFGLSVLILDISRNKKNIKFHAICFILLLAGYYIAKFSFHITSQIIFYGNEFFSFQRINTTRIYALYFSIPLLVLAVYSLSKWKGQASMLLKVVALLILSAIVLIFPLKDSNILPDNFRYLAYTEKWGKILNKALLLQSDDRIINFYTNKALYYTGKLSTDMFAYPQTWGEYALFLTTLTEPTTLMDNSDLFYELGHIGAARYWAFEAQTVYENRPTILKRLAECNIILGNYDAAKPFALKLSKSIIHRKEANYYLQLIKDTTLIEKDKQLMYKRRCTPKIDVFLTKRNPENELKMLVKTNPSNRMAYEYLQTFYLLHNDVKSFVDNVSNLHSIGIDFLPKIYEEAVLTLYYMTKVSADTVSQFRVSDDTKYRFNSYLRTISNAGGDFEIAKPFLKESFGDTYWYYLHYISPITLKKEIKVEHD